MGLLHDIGGNIIKEKSSNAKFARKPSIKSTLLRNTIAFTQTRGRLRWPIDHEIFFLENPMGVNYPALKGQSCHSLDSPGYT